GRDLAMLAEMHQEEAFAPARQLAWTTFLIGLFSAIVLLIGVYGLAHYLTAPVIALVSAAERASLGDLSQEVPVSGEDELGVLAHAFNIMQAGLRESRLHLEEHAQILEQEVSERTRALEQRALQVQTSSQVAQQVISILDLDTLLEEIVHIIQARFGYYFVGVWLVAPKRQHVALHAGAGRNIALPLEPLRIPMNATDSIIIEVCKSGRARIADSLPTSATYLGLEQSPDTLVELALPLRMGDSTIGVLAIGHDQPGAFGAEERLLLQTLADQIAIAIRNAQLYQGEQHRRVLAETLRDVSEAINSSLEREQVLRLILEQLARVVEYDSASLMLRSGDTLEIVAHRSIRPTSGPFLPVHIESLPHVHEAMEMQSPVIISDTLTYPGWQHRPEYSYIRCWLGVPLVAQERVIGLLNLNKGEPGFYSERDAEFTMAFVSQATIAIENARLFEAVNQLATDLDTVLHASLSLTSSLELTEVLKMIVNSAFGLLNKPEDVHIFLYEGGRLVFGTAITSEGHHNQPYSEPRQDGLTYTVARTGQPIIVPNFKTHPLFANAPADWNGSIVGLPLKIGSRVVGVVNFAYTQPRDFTEADLRVLRLLADQAAIAIENARLYGESHRQVEELSTLYDASRALASTLELTGVMEIIAAQLTRATDTDICVISSWDQQTQAVVTEFTVSLAEAQASYPLGMRYALAEYPLTARVLQDRTIVTPRVDDPESDQAELQLMEEVAAQSLLMVPLVGRGQVIGLVEMVDTRSSRDFSPQDIRLVEALSAQAAAALNNARLFDQTQGALAEQQRA
ncbi:MAG: GAF domain-containing protein, partial [Ardenticatenales bacterium]|nr:GAF domain-containing protein [Ardenticatenales bacterium]